MYFEEILLKKSIVVDDNGQGVNLAIPKKSAVSEFRFICARNKTLDNFKENMNESKYLRFALFLKGCYKKIPEGSVALNRI